ncbi:MAG: iron ABC transporter permease [Synechococcaceae cyanobacterium SM2_3_1]|nr:iron ABC transporter permease [Synechococcaceae cyanobacterium SM2_3_1]
MAVLLGFGLVLMILLSLSSGAVDLTLSQIWQGLLHHGDPMAQTILWDLRLPRVMIALLVGAALGVAGALLQGMLGNGLADPFLLGISAGAGLAAVGLISLGSLTGWVPLAAWIGGIATTTVVYGLARTPSGLPVERLILAGVAISALFGALSSTLLLMADDRVQLALNWLIGSLNGRSWPEVKVVGPYILLGLGASLTLTRSLNLLSLGEEIAVGLGLRLARTRLWIGGTATLLAAASVSVSGLIGFVGLVVPHIVRQLVGQDYRWVLPLSAVVGATLLAGADLLSRQGAVELPVGVVTALTGAPFFGWLLYQRGRS